MTVLYRVKEIKIGVSAQDCTIVSGIKNVKWADSDPWVVLEVPKGEAIWQHLKSIIIEGSFTTLDLDGIETALYNQDVSSAEGDQSAINLTTKKRTVIEYFVVTIVEIDGTEKTYTFSNVRIRTVGIEDLTEDGQEAGIVVNFYAERVD